MVLFKGKSDPTDYKMYKKGILRILAGNMKIGKQQLYLSTIVILFVECTFLKTLTFLISLT